tara:strand:+ start:1678 stop:2634 length:957 start_codon:yes stop_codon:yes gene_type:complete
MKKLFLLIGLTVTFSYSQVTDENGTAANGTGSTNLAGNIGIGITPSSSSPYKLQVNGASRFFNNLLIGDPNGARTEINTSTNHKIYAPTNLKTIDIDGNFLGGGFVGVYRADNQERGVFMHSQPTNNNNALVVREMRSDLIVYDAIKLSSEVFNTDITPTNYIEVPSQKSTIIIGDDINYKLGQGYGLINKLKTSFENDVHLETGNLGIGTTSFVDGSDTYRLSVDGKVRAHAIKVYTDWADFVFEKDYNLPTLIEVEKYILENGHLMNIPSAEEVEENGIELGEMNKLLLQKIEELTLYTIELRKEVDSLKKKINTK